MRPQSLIGAAAIAAVLCSTSLAQTCGQWRTSLAGDVHAGGIAGVDGPVDSMMTWDRDGPGPLGPVVVITGRFQIAGGVVAGVPNEFGGLWGGAVWDGSAWSRFPGPPPEGVPRSPFRLLGARGSALIGVVDEQTRRIVSFDGATWSSIGEANGNVTTMETVNGELFFGGSFTQVNQVSAKGVARWDGATWHAVGDGLSGGVVNSIRTYENSVVAGGAFTLSGGVPAAYVAKWDGAAWTALGTISPREVSELAVVGNDLIAAFKNPATTIASRWNGVAWGSLPTPQSSAAPMAALSGLSVRNGELFAFGHFYIPEIDLSYAARVGKWSLAGGWVAYDPKLPNGISAAFAAWRGDEMVVAPANWSSPYTQPVVPIRRFDGAGFRPAGDGFDGGVIQLVEYGGRFMAIGPFTAAGGEFVAGVARLEGGGWSSMTTGLPANFSIAASTAWEENAVIAGDFSTLGGAAGNSGVGKWSGTGWVSVGSPIGGSRSIANMGAGTWNGQLIVGFGRSVPGSGSFGDDYVREVRRFDGSGWSTVLGRFVMNPNAGPLTFATVGGDLVVGGDFTSVSGVAALGVAKWNGQTWSAIGSLYGSWDHQIKVLSHAGGLYAASNPWVTRWTGDTWEILGPTTVSGGESIGGVVSYRGELWASSVVRGLSRWDGQAWQRAGGTRLGPAASLVASGDDLVVGGFPFGVSDGRVVGAVARWTPEPDPLGLSPPANELNVPTLGISTIVFGATGTGPFVTERVLRNGVEVASAPWLYATDHGITFASYAQRFSLFNPRPSDAGAYQIVVSSACGSVVSDLVAIQVRCSADFNVSGAVDAYDLIDYLNAWLAKDRRTDFGGPGGADIGDLYLYLGAWLAGC